MLHDGSGPESPVLGKYCGNVVPNSLVATSNEIWVVFSSDGKNSNKKGFNLTLESAQIGCGMMYTSESGEFSTKNYPLLYPNNEECEWTIGVWPGNKVSLNFVERFNLEQSVNCTKDYVQVIFILNYIFENIYISRELRIILILTGFFLCLRVFFWKKELSKVFRVF